MAINVGDKVPTATLRVLGDDGMAEVSTDELFNGKKVAFFAVHDSRQGRGHRAAVELDVSRS